MPTIVRPSTEEIRVMFDGDEDSTAINGCSAGEAKAIADLDEIVSDDATITLFRDYEGFACAMIEGDDRFYSLYITASGRVGYGGVNQPEYFASVAEYLAAQ